LNSEAATKSGAAATPDVAAIDAFGPISSRIAAYLELTKPRVLTMVLITTLAGFYMASGAGFDYLLVFKTLIGTALTAGGTLALNQYIERVYDAKMRRTQARPLPSGRLHPLEALAFGGLTTIAGLLILWFAVNPLACAVTATITVLYLGAYTPMKRYTWICQIVGAVPGALPPVIGWAAARQSIGVEPIVLFAIMFLWQLPHSLSIARLYREDYARAGIYLLPRERAGNNPADSLMIGATIVLVLVGILPTLMGFAGIFYLATAIVLGAFMLYQGIKLVRAKADAAAARSVMMASLIYLPAVLLVMVLDKL
jgi:protoheme IX farnesyltransferase